MTRYTHRVLSPIPFALFIVAALVAPSAAQAETIACRSLAPTVKAVTIAEDYFPVTTVFQPNPNLQTLLETTISVTGAGLTCVVATFSAVVKPSDNYMVFQVTLDGVPMLGHTRTYLYPDVPVVIEVEETDLNQPRMIAHQFFMRVSPGVHTVRVSVSQGSGAGPYNSTVEAPVLTLHYY